MTKTAIHEIAKLKRQIAQLQPEAVQKREAAAIDHLERLAALADPEAEHSAGDNIISEFLRDSGYADLANAFDEARANWWYS